MNSTHKVEVVPVVLEKHPNANALSLVKVHGYQVCTGTKEWTGRTPEGYTEDGRPFYKAAYVPPDNLVPVSRPEFAFLADKAKQDGMARIRAIRLRGEISFGLLVPAPDDASIGDDVTERLCVEHYVPPLPGDSGKKGLFMGGETSPPPFPSPKYDLEAFRRYSHVLLAGERVVLTEKLDGTSARYVYWEGKMHCGSRNEWKKEFPDYSHVTVEWLVSRGATEEAAREAVEKVQSKKVRKNLWWEVLERTPELEKFCRDHPGIMVYGECAGTANVLKYSPMNFFAAFDLFREGRWVDYHEARSLAEELPWVPELDECPYDFATVVRHAEGKTTWWAATNDVIREGCVVKPLKERTHEKIGRVALKCVSADYLCRNFDAGDVSDE